MEIGLGLLAKGPVIALHTLPGRASLPFRGARLAQDEGARGSIRPLPGIGLALLAAALMAGMWVVPAALSGGAEYRMANLRTQSAGRVNSSVAHARTVWFHAAMLPVLLCSRCAIPALWRVARLAAWNDPGLRLALVRGGGALLRFSAENGRQLH